MVRPYTRIYATPEKLAQGLAKDFASEVKSAEASNKVLNIALSGGSTPKLLFKQLASSPFRDKVKWDIVHLYWGDERFVPPEDPDSNYGMTRQFLLEQIEIPEENVHRIRGEAKPEEEADRYSQEILKSVQEKLEKMPRFDWIFLGMGDDGHTASLFPGSDALGVKDKVCTVAFHPTSGQKRITLTLPVINSAHRISFLVTSEKKSGIVKNIYEGLNDYQDYPAAMVNPQKGSVEWCLDNAAASGLVDKINSHS